MKKNIEMGRFRLSQILPVTFVTVLFAEGTWVSAGELPVPAAALTTLGRADLAFSPNGNDLVINQRTNQAILNWQSFNIGKDNTVEFKQPNAQSIALNNIFQNDPSQILGKMSANGQVYLINQNGFVFGKDAKVDTNSLLVSTLAVSDETLQRGITKVVGQDGSAALVGTGEIYRKDAKGNFILDENGNKQKIEIQFLEGSKVTTAKNGRLIAAAPKVSNAGTLEADEGQILMVAASDRVYLQEASGDPALRGLVVEVKTGGEVTNTGDITTHRGNTTLMGFAVNQSGRISANTSVSANGSIRLIAREGATAQSTVDGYVLKPGTTARTEAAGDGLGTSAEVTFGKGSQTVATPDLADATKAVDAQDQVASKIEVMAKNITVADQAVIRSNSGKVSLVATENPQQPLAAGTRNDSQIKVDSGAVIDVSGVKGVKVPVSRNVVTVELRSNELRDSPLQRQGVLYGQKVQVDLRKGTPLADISGATARIERTVAERSTTGGTLNLSSEGQVALGQSSRIDFSGGSLDFLAGFVKTTQLIRGDGRTVDIGSADPNAKYIGLGDKVIEKYKDWNVTNKEERAGPTSQGRYEEGYTEGKSAGTLNIAAAVADLQGEMQAIAVNGTHQRTIDQSARGGIVHLDLARTIDKNQSVVFVKEQTQGESGGASSNSTPLQIQANMLRRSGIQTLTVNTNGRIEVAEEANLDLLAGSTLALTGGEIRYAGRLESNGGHVAFNTVNTGLGETSGKVEITETSRVNLSGLWNNDKPATLGDKAVLDTSPIFQNGGDFTVHAKGNVTVAAGSEIDVSGGAHRTQDGKVHAGNGGSILLSAEGNTGSDLTFDGKMTGYAFTGGKGGSLTLASNEVVIGSVPETGLATQTPLVIDPTLATKGGFESYHFVSNKSGLQVSPGTDLTVKVENRLLDETAVYRKTGSDFREFSRVALEPELSRPAGEIYLKVALKADLPQPGAGLLIGEGSRVATGVGGKINLSSDTSIWVNGELNAPAGLIEAHVTPPSEQGELGFLPTQGIWLSDTANLLARGAALTYTDGYDRIRGTLFDGGKVNLTADRGFIETSANAQIDVSGISRVLDNPTPGPNGSIAYRRELVGSEGGEINLTAAEGMQILGNLQGQPGTPRTVSGGALKLEINTLNRRPPGVPSSGQLPFPTAPSVIELSQTFSSDRVATDPVKGVLRNDYGLVRYSADQVASGGFSTLRLVTPDEIRFVGGVSLATNRAIDLDAPILRAALDPQTFQTGDVSINAPFVTLGSSLVRPGSKTPDGGTSTLDVAANQIDLRGTSVLRGFGTASLRSEGDIRLQGIRLFESDRDFLGEFALSGNLTLSASQISPATLSEFTLAVKDKADGRIDIEGNGNAAGPMLSAAGKLTISAPTINQGGTLRAPLGAIDLKASEALNLLSGSVTSDSAAGSVIPFGRLQAGLEWIYPLGAQNLVYKTPPAKSITLSGDRVNFESGATIDSQGGGDLLAFEFLPGPGGSYDRLDPTSKGYVPSFAVLPSFNKGSAPLDPLETPVSSLRVGDTIHLEGGAGLKAGEYVLLPAHYALLPGAYLITPQALRTDIAPGQDVNRGDGAKVIAGYYSVSGTRLRAPIWQGFAVEKGSQALTRSEFALNTANQFFGAGPGFDSSAPAWLPQDGGQVQVSAGSELKFDGSLMSGGEGKKGRGGQLDIAANQISVLAPADAGQTAGGSVVLNADALNQLDVSSLSIGGLRKTTGNETTLEVKADQVTIGKGVELQGQEIVLSAKQQVTVANGASLTASAEGGSKARTALKVEGDSALVRVSSAAQSELFRSKTQGTQGSILIEEGSKLAASGAMLLDATAANTLAGTLEVKDASLALGADRISLGALDSRAGGLMLSDSLLAALNPSELILSSGTDISFFGAPALSAKTIALHAGTLNGFAGAGTTASLSADTLTLDNRNQARSAVSGEGSGGLSLSAKTVTLGEGDYSLKGFSSVSIAGSEGLKVEGNANVAVAGDLTLAAPFLTAGASTNARVDVSGHALRMNGTGTGAPALEALGARLSLTADQINSSMNVRLPSGAILMEALKGDLTLSAGAILDVAGREVKLGQKTLLTDGGLIGLKADLGQITLAEQSSLLLSGQNAGELAVTVPTGGFNWQGKIDAAGRTDGGRFAATVGAADTLGPLGILGDRLKASGFADGIALTAKSGDWTLERDQRLAARTVALVAEKGAVRLEGQVLSQGENAEIAVTAATDVELGEQALLKASGVEARGGRVAIDTVSLDPENAGGIKVKDGARIDVTGEGELANGAVLFRVARTGDAVAVEGPAGAAIRGSAKTVVEADKVFKVDGPITAAVAEGWKSDAMGFMGNASATEATLGLNGEVKAGILALSTGDLLIDSEGLDLSSWHEAGRAGVLTLRAQGTVRFDGSLSDGFEERAEALTLADGKKVSLLDALQAENSWSYRIVAGQDIVIGADQTVRTGNGDIELLAGRDITLANAGSAIYTMGKAATSQRYGSVTEGQALANYLGEYPIEGGSLRLEAGRDVVGAVTGQFFDGWLQRAGNWTNAQDHSGETPTAWAVHVGGFEGQTQARFQQNVGALGGGNITVEAGRNIQDLSTVIATTGKPVGALAGLETEGRPDFLSNDLQIQGGGNLKVSAGSDILGGTYSTARGDAEIHAQGSILKSQKTGMGAVLAVADSRFTLDAGDRVEVGAALNPTVIADSRSNNYFFTYSPLSALNVSALSGGVVLQNDTNRLVDQLNRRRPYEDRILFPGLAADALNVYPATLSATALQGDIRVERSLVMYPSASGKLRLNAGGDIKTAALDSFVYLTMSDADPTLLPTAALPATSWNEASRRLQPFGPANYIHAPTPIHKTDFDLAEINAGGSILGIDPILFTLPTGANISAGLDIRDASFSLQHPNVALSTVTAGRDFKFTTPRNRQGNLINSAGQVALAGPGDLLISAGRNIDLGAAIGIYSTANTVNSALPQGDGSITVLAGMGEKGPQYAAFAQKYDPLASDYADLLTAFMSGLSAEPITDKSAAALAYQALPQSQKDLFLFDILFEQLRISATKAAKSGKTEDYAQGYDAINTLFPDAGSENSTYKGDLSLFFSKISTLSGGDINMLTPGGSVNAGLASAFTGSKQSSDLGVVVQGSGSINSQVNMDFMVNQSRVFALNGGDITIWSSNGDIDAGRGAKAALTIPPPLVTFDASGNLKIVYPPAVSGSGIRTASSSVVKPGDVYLAAPRGVVDAGEAGIGGSNITIAATAVLGANNIQVGGSSTGVPTAGAGVAIAPAGAAAAATAAANTAESAVNNDTNQAKERNNMADNAMNPLSVDILGFGECGVADVREGKPGCV